MSRYNVKETEAKWQSAWNDAGCFSVTEDPNKPKYYVLDETHPDGWRVGDIPVDATLYNPVVLEV